MASQILRDKERQTILSCLQREQELLRDLEAAEACGHNCKERRERVQQAMDYLRGVKQEFIGEFQL